MDVTILLALIVRSSRHPEVVRSEKLSEYGLRLKFDLVTSITADTDFSTCFNGSPLNNMSCIILPALPAPAAAPVALPSPTAIPVSSSTPAAVQVPTTSVSPSSSAPRSVPAAVKTPVSEADSRIVSTIATLIFALFIVGISI
jgi:hypothetical protein